MQTPAPFEYERATSVDNALGLLERHGPEARTRVTGWSSGEPGALTPVPAGVVPTGVRPLPATAVPLAVA